MISVIVPVYNTEKYLEKCIQSIVSQTFTDFELILVDDGSTDRSGEMCDTYAYTDKRISVIHKQNGGPSEARNQASIKAKGELITFIDSDDFVTPDYLQTLYDVLIQTKADISAVLMTELQENDEPKRTPSTKRKIITISGHNALLNVLYQKDLDTTPCGMLFKKQIVCSNPFPVGKFHEDDFTMFKYFEQAEQVSIIKQVKYYYVQHESSIMHQKTDKIIQDEIEASDNLEEYFSGKDNDLLRAARSKKFSNYCQILVENPNLRDCEKYDRKIIEYLCQEKTEIIKDKNTRIKNKIAALILYIGPQMLSHVYSLISKK